MKWYHWLLALLAIYFIIKNTDFSLGNFWNWGDIGGNGILPGGELDPNDPDCPLPQSVQEWNIAQGNPPCTMTIKW